jgi:hypothetical protein
MRDLDIRRGLRATLFRSYERDSQTRIIEELGICEGAARIDAAVVNGQLAGFEIKSERDTLARLPRQLSLYARVFDRVTIITTARHVDTIAAMVPDYCGLRAASERAGQISLRMIIPAQLNVNVDSFAIAQLLWRDELVELVGKLGITKGLSGKRRRDLCNILAGAMPLAELKQAVRHRLQVRANWRDYPKPHESGAMSPHSAMCSNSPRRPCHSHIEQCTDPLGNIQIP